MPLLSPIPEHSEAEVPPAALPQEHDDDQAALLPAAAREPQQAPSVVHEDVSAPAQDAPQSSASPQCHLIESEAEIQARLAAYMEGTPAQKQVGPPDAPAQQDASLAPCPLTAAGPPLEHEKPTQGKLGCSKCRHARNGCIKCRAKAAVAAPAVQEPDSMPAAAAAPVPVPAAKPQDTLRGAAADAAVALREQPHITVQVSVPSLALPCHACSDVMSSF